MGANDRNKDVAKCMEMMQTDTDKKYLNDNSELSQDELMNVAGGRWGFCVIIGGSDGGAASASWCGAGACYYVGLGFAFLDPDRDVRDGRVQ
jgi:hypothetical protein